MVKPWLAKHTRVVRRHPHLGIMWLNIKIPNRGLPIFMAACYLPPSESSYYKESGFSLQNHFDTLRLDSAEFQLKGKIIICGDMNARVGEKPDIPDNIAWVDMGRSGIAVPDVTGNNISSIPVRHTTDKKHNKSGIYLLDVCKATGLIICNGRLPGDNTGEEGGACTFYARGKNAQSLIDFFIISPELVMKVNGRTKKGCMLHVSRSQELIQETDHACVSLTLRIECQQSQTCTPENERTVERFKFRKDVMEVFVAAVSSGGIAERLKLVGMNGMSAAQSVHLFDLAMSEALRYTHDRCGGIVMKPPQHGGKEKGRRSKVWYSQECSMLRAKWRANQRLYGIDSRQAHEARHIYRKTTRTTRQQHEQRCMADLVTQWKHDPRTFWRSFKEETNTCVLNDMNCWATYFKKLFTANIHEQAYDSFANHCDMNQDLFGEPTEAQCKQAEVLNAPFTEDEVKAALDIFRRGRSPGVDGKPAEFMMDATVDVGEGKSVNVLVPCITRLFNAVFTDHYPEEWAVAALVPIKKPKGDPVVYDDYRGIAVGTAISKLYSTVLNMRGNKWAEGNGFRAKGQFGFRKGMGTVEAAFILRHTIEECAAKQKAVYCAFIDFKKAYDSVDRNLLWQCLIKMGINGKYLNTLKQMYSNVCMQVRLQGRLSERFTAEAGVKQGDPLSPLLFGLFIDRVERFFSDRLGPDIGVMVADQIRRVLLYADDLVLTAEKPEDLQRMLDCLRDFCVACQMTVNVTKSEIVCFNRHFAPSNIPRFIFNGTILPIKEEFKYLGIYFHDSGKCGGVCGARDRQVKAARYALHMMWRNCYTKHLHNVRTLDYLFSVLVQPVASYGCEVWAPDVLTNAKGKLNRCGVQEQLLHSFMRQALGVRDSTSIAIMLKEMNRIPIWAFWMRQCCKFWNRIVARPNDDYIKMCLTESVRMAMKGNTRCWAHHFLQGMCAMRALDRVSQAWECEDSQTVLQRLDMGRLTTAVESCMQSEWEGIPNGAPRDIPDDRHHGFKLAVYTAWFQSARAYDKNGAFTALLEDRRQIVDVARFRMGSHNLDVEARRYGENRATRSQRICRCCDMMKVEDETHFMMECPLYLKERSLLWEIIGAGKHLEDSDMQYMMNGDKDSDMFQHWKAVAMYIGTCNKLRSEVISGSG